MVQERGPDTVDINVNMGPQHPSTHGVFRMVLTIDGERVIDVEPHIGYMHRGAEKLSENMDYRAAIGYQDRTDYLAQFLTEQAYCMAVEKLLELEVPERSEYIRVILCELNRVTSHLMFLGAFGIDLGYFGTSFTYGFRERERLQDIFEEVTGERMMYGYFRPGGLAWDVPDNFVQMIRDVLPHTRQGLKDLDMLMTQNEIVAARTKGIGAMNLEDSINWGLSGPMLRAAGSDWDLRKDKPYSIYDRFDYDIPVGSHGDVFDRYLVRLEEAYQSLRIVEQALDQLPDGPIMPEKMPRRLRGPDAEVYAAVEGPRGEYGIYIVSKGGDKAYRLKIRAPSFCNLAALRDMTVGNYVADAVAILGSIDIVLCDVDR
ncbi:MAG: NADH-quinone oxidoreductase subunit D [Chloroflexi bacterium]|nr:NADH-quinone oxidoreductase subunit D [Chloroflexota bacterium]